MFSPRSQTPSGVHLGLAGLEKPSRSVVLGLVSFFFVEGTPPLLVALLGISSHGFGLSKIRLVSDSSEELVDWFFKNHVDPLPHSTLVVNRALLMLFK